MKIQQTAYILHRKPYRNTSYIIDFFTQDYGIISAVARAQRNSKQRGIESFVTLWIEYSIRTQLATLHKIELLNHDFILLSGQKLYCGFYLNELLLKLLAQQDSYPKLFDCYQQTLVALAAADNVEPVLRCFELKFLHEIGYGIQFPLDGTQKYYYVPNTGFITVDAPEMHYHAWPGSILQAIAAQDFTDPIVLKAAKIILRAAIAHVLEGRRIVSRELFCKGETYE